MYIRLPSLSGTIHLDFMRCNANKHYNILYNLFTFPISPSPLHPSLHPVPKYSAPPDPEESGFTPSQL
jgi:hypothetical protein